MFALANNRGGWHPLGTVVERLCRLRQQTVFEGEVTLKGAGADLDAEPVIHFNQFADQRDLDRLVDAMRLAYRFMSNEAMQGGVNGMFPSTFSEKARDLAVVSSSNWLKTKAAALLLDFPADPNT